MSFPPPLNPLERQLTCCGLKKTEYMEDLRKERKEIVNLLKSSNDPSSQFALEERQRKINSLLVALTKFEGCPCNGECKKILMQWH